jgi:alpha-tubulin suppressor-like RCC1 family protein
VASAGAEQGAPTTFVKSVGAGTYHTCALFEDGQVLCWGNNFFGQLGTGTNAPSPLDPLPISLPSGKRLTGVRALAVGYNHNCALVDEGEVLCWGWNKWGQLGDGTTTDRYHPVSVELAPGVPLSGVQALALGNGHTCALLGSGEVHCWGRNRVAQLGNGRGETFCGGPACPGNEGATQNQNEPPPQYRLYPAPVEVAPGVPLVDVRALVSGAEHSCAVMAAGEIRCWGRDVNRTDSTRLGEGRAAPVLLSPGVPFMGVQSLALGFVHNCALIGGGEVRCWGRGYEGQLGDGGLTPRESPVAVLLSPDGPPLTGARAVALGNSHGCVVLDGGEVHCWGGDNQHGQLGDGTMVNRPTPVPVVHSPGGARLTGVQALALGFAHGCALTIDRDVLCWGQNDQRQLGNGRNVAQPFAAPVTFSCWNHPSESDAEALPHSLPVETERAAKSVASPQGHAAACYVGSPEAAGAGAPAPLALTAVWVAVWAKRRSRSRPQ